MTVGMQLARSRQLAQDGEHATGSVNVFHVIQRCAGSDLAQLRHVPGKRIYVSHREIKFGFLCGGEQMQNGVGRSAHGNIEAHRILKRGSTSNVSWKNTVIVFKVVASREFHHESSCL